MIRDTSSREAVINGPVPIAEIAAVILSGGRARRMDGQDKGLLPVGGIPLVERVLRVLEPQVGSLVISANRHLDRYRAYGVPVIEDDQSGFLGPLSGIAAAMRATGKPYLACVPCDSPLVPGSLVATLFQALTSAQADICVAHDGTRTQQLFALMRCALLSDLRDYLDSGGRRVDAWHARHRVAVADCSAWPDAFLNVNTAADWTELERRLDRRDAPD